MTPGESAEVLKAAFSDQAVIAAHVEEVIRSNYGTAGMDDSLSLEELVDNLKPDEIVALVAAGVKSYRDYALGYAEKRATEQAERLAERQNISDEFRDRLKAIVEDIELAGGFNVTVGTRQGDGSDRHYLQIRCWRMDTITKEMGYGYGGKAYVSRWAVDSEIVGTIFSLYKGYVEHEARESFKWQGRRIYGPHIDIVALKSIARKVSFRGPAQAGE